MEGRNLVLVLALCRDLCPMCVFLCDADHVSGLRGTYELRRTAATAVNDFIFVVKIIYKVDFLSVGLMIILDGALLNFSLL